VGDAERDEHLARQKRAIEIRIRAERRCGELLAATEKAKGGRPMENMSVDAKGFAEPKSSRFMTRR
jgi:hypothetical protein